MHHSSPRSTHLLVELALVLPLLGLAAPTAGCGDDSTQTPSETCCVPSQKPGQGGNPTCFEGATCCADGTWRCNEGDGSHTCNASGGVCRGGACDPALEPGTGNNPACFEGATCCPDGQWRCNGASGEHTCRS